MSDAPPPEDIDPQSVLVVGEYTTSDGPWADDHFLVVVFRSRWVEIPMGEAGKTIDDLERALGTKLEPALCNSADFASRVIHPPALRDKPLFEFTFGRGSVMNLGLVRDVTRSLTDEVRRHVEASPSIHRRLDDLRRR